MSEVLILLTVILNAALGFWIFFRNRKSPENFFYALFVIFLDFWILANFLENEPGRVGLERLGFFLRLDFMFGALFMYAWLRFCIALAVQSGYKLQGKTWISWIGGAIAAAFVPLTLLTPLVVKNLQFYDSVIHFESGPLWIPYALFVLAGMVGGPLVLFRSRRFARRVGNEPQAKNIRSVMGSRS